MSERGEREKLGGGGEGRGGGDRERMSPWRKSRTYAQNLKEKHSQTVLKWRSLNYSARERKI